MALQFSMDQKLKVWLNRKIPQNFIIGSPITGSIILGSFGFLFLLLYKPLEVDKGHFSYEVTIGLYSIISAVTILVAIFIIKKLNRFQNNLQWNIRKEIEAIFIVLSAAGFVIYFAGFLVEESIALRWSVWVFFDSVFKTFLVAGIPFIFFTTLNIYALSTPAKIHPYEEIPEIPPKSNPIELETTLKNEDFYFYPDEFVYAKSDGNYVQFVLDKGNKPQKRMVRCTLNNVEKQLRDFPYLYRTHRAYIVNLKKIEHISGNSLGYQLHMPFFDERIPVARSRASDFKKACSNIS